VSGGLDQAIQPFSLARVSATIGKNFDGLSDSSNGAVGTFVPSDDNIAVGATQVVETINSAYRVYNKSTGASVLGPKQVSSIFTGITGLCGQGATSPNFTDPIVLYDKISGRWVITILAVNSTFTTGNECIAVSSTSHETGNSNRYAFRFGSQLLKHYHMYSVWTVVYSDY